MVRVGTLPFRLLCQQYGADIVYSEELIDKKLLKTKRVINGILESIKFLKQAERLKTVDYILDTGEVRFFREFPFIV